MSQYIALVKRDYTPVANSYDEVIPGNIHALKKGLEALLSEDARDNVRARELWAEAEGLLAQDSEDETGASAGGAIKVEDTFFMGTCSDGWSYWGTGTGW